MDERWTQIRKLFRAALDVDEVAREQFVEEQNVDPDIRDRVLSMLAAYDDDDTFLEKPVIELNQRGVKTSRPNTLVGQTVGPYLIRRMIAQGGMGVVFEAFDTKLEKVVALKMMNPALMQDMSFKKRFEQEAKTLARLEDPHFVRVYALIEEQGKTFIVMEYIQGITLAEHIRAKGQLSQREVAGIGMQLLLALSKAHRQNIIHRDLKPSNIMLTRTDDGRSIVKVLDFGIAKHLQGNNTQTRTQGTVGTLFYMSPEQIRALPDIDHRTDIYSVGVTLYEALHGGLPFDITRDEFTIRKQIVEGQLLALTPDQTHPVDRVLAKSLNVLPNARYQSAEEMRLALRNTMQPTSSANRALKRPDQLQVHHTEKPAPGKKRLPRILVPIGLLAIALLAFTLWLNADAPPDTPEIDQPVTDPARAINSASNQDTLPAPDTISTGDVRPNDDIPAETRPNLTLTDDTPATLQTQPENEPDQASQSLPDPGEDTNTDPESSQEDSLTRQPETPPPPQIEDVPSGTITFSISPPGDIYIDDQLHATERILPTISLAADTYNFMITNDQARIWKCDIAVAANRDLQYNVLFDNPVSTPVVVALHADTRTAIRNAEIILDGNNTGSQTPMALRVFPGLHTIEAHLDGYETVDIMLDGASNCFQKVGRQVNIDAYSLSQGPDLKRIIVLLRETNN